MGIYGVWGWGSTVFSWQDCSTPGFPVLTVAQSLLTPVVPASRLSLGAQPSTCQDRGLVWKALPPGTRGTAGKAAAPSPVTHGTFLGNLVLNHS